MAKKKLTKKQAEKLLFKEFGHTQPSEYIGGLCCSIPEKLRDDFRLYWSIINTFNYDYISIVISDYDMNTDDYNTIVSLARLMIAHDFIEDTYE